MARTDNRYRETLVAVFVHQGTLAGNLVARIFPIRIHERCAFGDYVAAHGLGVCRRRTDVDILFGLAVENAEVALHVLWHKSDEIANAVEGQALEFCLHVVFVVDVGGDYADILGQFSSPKTNDGRQAGNHPRRRK